MNKLRANLAILLASIALGLSIWTSSQAFNNAGRALQQRERQLVQHYAPGVKKICVDFGVQPPADPKSIEELVEPLTKIVTRLQGN
jgi:hypothetical protein